MPDDTYFSASGHARGVSNFGLQERRYPPYNQEYDEQNEQMPLQLLTADEKITEL